GPFQQFAVITGASGVVVLDCDDEASAEWVVRSCPDTPMLVETPRGGVHAYYRENPELPIGPRQKVLGMALDIKARMSLAIAPDAWSRQHQRRWRFAAGPVPPEELPVL